MRKWWLGLRLTNPLTLLVFAIHCLVAAGMITAGYQPLKVLISVAILFVCTEFAARAL